MVTTFEDLLGERTGARLQGRDSELAALLCLLEQGGQLVAYVHGVAGIGKSTLVAGFARQARERGATVLRLDCRSIEPTERALVSGLGSALGRDLRSVEEVAERLGGLGEQVVVIFDTYEVFRTMDTWLRQAFAPKLPMNVRLVLAGREPPGPGWLTAPEWTGLFRIIAVGPLDEGAAVAILQRWGLSESGARHVNQVVRGHPLALSLAASRAQTFPDRPLPEIAAHSLVEDLTRLYLAGIDDGRSREVLEAASVVRRVTVPLLRAMLPDAAPQDAMDRLQGLSFVEPGWDGLHLHEAVQHAIAASLRANDPERHRHYRRAAWHALRLAVAGVGRSELWRYTADMLYLLENPVVRDAFFPNGAPQFAVEPAVPGDGAAIIAMSRRHEQPEGTAILASWWEQAPQTFWVVRESDGAVAGYFCPFASDAIPVRTLRHDPILKAWTEHLKRDPVPQGQRCLFYPRWQSRDYDEGLSPVQSATWLEMKRQYMEMRPALRRVYVAQRDVDTQWAALKELGFRRLEDADVRIGSVLYRTVMLDFGPASVDGWLARLVGAELGVEDQDILDRGARSLALDGAQVPLSRLEFLVVEYLSRNAGKAVSRQALLNDVWGYDYMGGSNVVDVVVRSLRKKLGQHSHLIETVTGVGYRLKSAVGGGAPISQR